jgi:hypothetical protein
MCDLDPNANACCRTTWWECPACVWTNTCGDGRTDSGAAGGTTTDAGGDSGS